jgi:hypothetical protein
MNIALRLAAVAATYLALSLLVSVPVTVPILLLFLLGVPWWLVVPLAFLALLLLPPIMLHGFPQRCSRLGLRAEEAQRQLVRPR